MTYISEPFGIVNTSLDVVEKKIEPTPYSAYRDFTLCHKGRLHQTFVKRKHWHDLLTSHQLTHIKANIYELRGE